MTKYWLPGETVIFRHLEADSVRFAAPYRVVEDSARRTVLYMPRFSVVYSLEGNRLAPAQWNASVLRIIEPGAWYSLLFFWSANAERTPMHWYLNLEEPARRFDGGFESRDLILDVILAPEGGVPEWKDSAEFETAVTSGLISIETAERVRSAAADVIAKAETTDGPFAENWPLWQAADDTVSVLPDRWWVVEGQALSELEPNYDLYTDDEHLDWAVELVRRVRREKAP